MNEEILLH